MGINGDAILMGNRRGFYVRVGEVLLFQSYDASFWLRRRDFNDNTGGLRWRMYLVTKSFICVISSEEIVTVLEMKVVVSSDSPWPWRPWCERGWDGLQCKIHLVTRKMKKESVGYGTLAAGQNDTIALFIEIYINLPLFWKYVGVYYFLGTQV